jgi:hypothetical protein
MEGLKKKLQNADKLSEGLREKVKQLTDARLEMREQLAKCDEEDWATRVHSLILME